MALIGHQPGVFKRCQMMAERRFAYVEMLGELPAVQLPSRSSSKMRRRVGSASALKPSPGIEPPLAISRDVHTILDI